MRIFILVINYWIIWMVFLALLPMIRDWFDFIDLFGVCLFLFIGIPNVIYAHMTKPTNPEIEALKKTLDELKANSTPKI